jgi:hypothetical protein
MSDATDATEFSFDETDVENELSEIVYVDDIRARMVVTFAKTKHNEKSGDYRLGLGVQVLHPEKDVGIKGGETIWPTFGIAISNPDFSTPDKKHIPSSWTKRTWKQFCQGVLSDQGHLPAPRFVKGVPVFNGEEINKEEAEKKAVELARLRLEEGVKCLKTKGQEYLRCVFYATIKQNPTKDGRMFYQLDDIAIEHDPEEYDLTPEEEMLEQYNPFGLGEE